MNFCTFIQYNYPFSIAIYKIMIVILIYIDLKLIILFYLIHTYTILIFRSSMTLINSIAGIRGTIGGGSENNLTIDIII